MPIVQFLPFSSLVQPSFWHALTELKIDILRLSDDAFPVAASYSTGRSIIDRETGQRVELGCNLSLGGEAFRPSDQQSLTPFSVPAVGVLKNFNTIEEFKVANKSALFKAEVDKIWENITANRSTALLNHFLLITFGDLKKYKYYYWFSFPAFVAQPPWEADKEQWRPATDVFKNEQMTQIFQKLRAKTIPYFLVKIEQGGGTAIAPVEEYEHFFKGVPVDSRTVGVIDPSASLTHPGWPLRNLLAYFRALFPRITSLRILCWRDSDPSSNNTWKSCFNVVFNTPSEGTAQPSAVGWEKNAQQKLGPRMADLAPMMDPERLASQAVDLNLKLMRWRILPALDLEKVAGTKCLLLGAGTLGCYVARTLMGWGVRHITFIDSSRVSFSNPVRQPLFEFADCLEGGKPKAKCAADALKKIFPGINSAGYSLHIPMPGHPVPPASIEQTKKDVEMLEKLFDEHDAIFLLMDSRESRWLPTVLGASKGKIMLNAALGFDSFLVMRHGGREVEGKPRLGCYYCNDIVAPTDSLTDRTLDQMCTVTRPGIAGIAASTAVELLASLLQHPDGIYAPAPPPSAHHEPDPSMSGSVLGLVPHQLRGFLAQFKNVYITGAAYSRCTGCSETVLKAYEAQGFDILLKAFNDAKFLEELTGLDKLYLESEAILDKLELEDEEEDF